MIQRLRNQLRTGSEQEDSIIDDTLDLHLQVREMHNGSNGVIGRNVVMKIGSNGCN